MKTFLIRGVPLAVQQDGWWVTGDTPKGAPTPGRHGKARSIGPLALLIPLIALGDVLVWQVLPGLSLAVFGALLVLAALWLASRQISGQRFALVLGGSILALLPLVELVQPLSMLIAICGVTVMLALLAGLNLSELASGALRLWPMGVRQTFDDATKLMGRAEIGGMPALFKRLLIGWLVPVVLGLVFVLLLLEANPVAMGWADALTRTDLPSLDRATFWLLLVPVIWTALSLTKMRERLPGTPVARKMGPARQGLINPMSVTRALFLFNAVFALQTAMDLIYLYGGVELPDGISYAKYAHRGAYPLVVTALLAGGFALLTRSWTDGNRMLRGLLMFWVAQNMMLVVSSLVRLDLYVGVYGLTHLRIAAAIWMGLVAGGLALILWQVWKSQNNTWLMLRGGAMAGIVLYLCTLVSFDAVIAQHNLSHSLKRDSYYLCKLGDAAKPIILKYERDTGKTLCASIERTIRSPRDWREWGFRNWRARNSLTAIQAKGDQ